MDRNMIYQCYQDSLRDIRELEEKKEKAFGIPMLEKMIDAQLKKRRDELSGIKYALEHMSD